MLLLYPLLWSMNYFIEKKKKANCLLATFPRVGPFILTRHFQSYCLSLYGSGLWSLSCPALQNIVVAFNKTLRRIWSLPACSHTCIVYLVANLRSLFNVIYRRSNSLLHAAAHCPSMLVQPFSVTLPSPASHFVVTTTCLVIIISSDILLRTILLL